MEYRIKDYIISGNGIILPRKTGIEDIRLIYNETQKILICSTAKKDNLGAILYNPLEGTTTTIVIPTAVCVLQPNDELTIKCDYGDDVESAKEEILTEVGKVSDAQAMIDELLAIQLETIIGKPKTDENT